MSQLTLTDLKALLQACAGTDEGVDLDGEVLDTEFTDLGYDSLALLEASSRIEREYSVRLDEEAVADATTPRRYLALVNAAL